MNGLRGQVKITQVAPHIVEILRRVRSGKESVFHANQTAHIVVVFGGDLSGLVLNRLHTPNAVIRVQRCCVDGRRRDQRIGDGR